MMNTVTKRFLYTHTVSDKILEQGWCKNDENNYFPGKKYVP